MTLAIITEYPATPVTLTMTKFFVNGQKKVSEFEDYTSHNTERLDLEGMVKLLGKLEMFATYKDKRQKEKDKRERVSKVLLG